MRPRTTIDRLTRPAVLAAAAVLAGGLAGCIPSQALDEGQMDEYWQLTAAAEGVEPATRPADEDAGFSVPTTWVIRQQDSLVWSTVSILRAMDALEAGDAGAKIAFSVSPDHARSLVDLMADGRAALADLREMIEVSGERTERNRWAAALASALTKIERISRMALADPPAEGEDPGEDDPRGTAAGPVFQMLGEYLNRRSGGGLLSDLTPGERTRLRRMLVGLVLRLGFEIAGKRATSGIRGEVAETMANTPDLNSLEASLTKLLNEQLPDAPPAGGGTEKRDAVLSVLKWAPKAIKFFESFLSQWDKMDAVTVEMLEAGEDTVAAVTFAVLPGKAVRIEDVMTGLPVVAFRGSTRMVVRPDATPAGEAVVTFDSVADNGAVELRFEGILYGLVRLFALPLASGPVREVRVSANRPPFGEQMLNVKLFTEADDDPADPRRMLVVQDARHKRLIREAFSIKTVVTASETTVSYITPDRRYTYIRTKGEAASDR